MLALLTLSISRRTVSAVSIRNVTTMASSLSFHQLETCESTQEEARSLLLRENKKPFLAVSAKQQHKGRGTSGRTWTGMSGNVFLTVAIPMERIPVKITLLPLQVGVLIATSLDKVLKQACFSQGATKVTLKWPNDVLLDHKKVAGVLIESQLLQEKTWLLVGIGINIQQAPQIPEKEGRQAACLQDYCGETLPETTAEIVAADLANRFVEWIELGEKERNVIEEWKKWAEFHTPQKLRDTGEMVIPISIENDGQLRVRLENGQERLLMADYLY